MVGVVGSSRMPLALTLTGCVLGIAIFSDVAYVILNPLVHSAAKLMNVTIGVMSIGLVGALQLTHAIVPPAPGPLAAAVSDKRNRAELPFILVVDGHKYSIKVRVRGKSRVRTCAFPPLRLNFSSIDTINTVFAVQDKLKLVTHCEKTLVPKRMHWRNIRNFEFLT